MKRLRWTTMRGLLLVALAVLVAGCTPFWAGQTKQPTPTQTQTCPAWVAPPALSALTPPASNDAQAVAQYNAQLVLQTPRPIRNLYGITQHLVKHLAQPISCLTRTTPRAERVGHGATFWVVNASQTGFHQIHATLVYATPHVYMYLQDGVSASLQAIQQSADRFENSSYVKDRSVYGQQWALGPDHDQHITVLNATGLGPIGGYFSSEDEFPRAVFPYSNERQMIYINLDGGAVPGTSFYDATLAHEFQHMIHWYWHPADPSWVNEGMSVLAQHLNGFTSGGVDQAFLQQPNTMLGGWSDDASANVAHYGAGYLFMDYFAEHYGGYPVLQQLLTNREQTPLNFDQVLAAHGYTDRFNDVFAKWVIANLLNDPNVAHGIYAYPTIPGETATVQHSVPAYPFTDGSAATPASVNQYATQYYDFTPAAGGQTLALTFHGAPYVGIVGNQPYGGARDEWWSNSANDMDSTLTHSFDLTSLAGKPVTLSFAAWYNLEPDFDYAYVEVSTDGGANWTPLPATTSTDTNPNGANYGHGMTGISGGGATPAWVQERVDLSAFAGKQIQVRFETITDDAVHYPGLTVDNIQIPQLNFADNVSTDNGWQAQGWVRSTNTLPERYVLQAVVYPAGQGQPQVRQIPVDPATGAAQISFAGLGGTISHVTLAVSALAPATIVPAQYQLTAQLQP
jgi:immune inhibitor A